MDLVNLHQQAAQHFVQNQYAEAIALYEQGIESSPQETSLYWHLGLAILLQGDEFAAQSTWLSILSQDDPEQSQSLAYELIAVLENAAQQRLQYADFVAAEKICRQILELDTTHEQAALNLGDVLFKQGKLDEAIACYQHLLQLKPNDTHLYNNLGVLFDLQGQFQEAMECYRAIIAIDPNNATAYYNLGQLLEQQGQSDEAIAHYQTVIQLQPDNVASYYNLGHLLDRHGRLEEAIAYYRVLITIDPDSPKAYSYLGFALSQQGKFDAAMAAYQQALDLNPDDPETHWYKAFLLLQLGNLTQGFAEFEWRWQLPGATKPHFSVPQWDGSPLQGRTILLHTEYGFGDTIQFIRYVDWVAERGGSVIVQCPPSLVRLLSSMPSIQHVIPMGMELPAFDVYAPLLSLPHLFKTTLDTIPQQIPYLAPPTQGTFTLEAPQNTHLKVGIAWAGNPDYPRDHSRSCSLQEFANLLTTPKVAFYSLQKGERVAELVDLPDAIAIQDLSGLLNDFANTAGAIAQLDLVITTDTAVAHLAGALGKPVWVLLSFVPDWRWLLDREDSPWYPTMRLFRQSQLGDWAGVFDRVTQALQQRLIESGL
ncbi:tetratricopeptide repeat protein [Oscillatoria sp. FACHB-1407]|uniref:tetratricopeptide repeat protein n=1 Tax=Oscillatoria sp. FACHB-1407 TaxID=2692847 RepID=UPI001689745E|nr:tetratricopeptide repeat protein [Oscillatoria sp. FACHB-1407]MBD2464965.1 tetratricopeptide repeat protein [Oscillatoria sp. FACHB-1407]